MAVGFRWFPKNFVRRCVLDKSSISIERVKSQLPGDKMTFPTGDFPTVQLLVDEKGGRGKSKQTRALQK